MSNRDEILKSIRANLPRLDRPLPEVRMFDANPPASLLAAFKAGLERMGGIFSIHRLQAILWLPSGRKPQPPKLFALLSPK